MLFNENIIRGIILNHFEDELEIVCVQWLLDLPNEELQNCFEEVIDDVDYDCIDAISVDEFITTETKEGQIIQAKLSIEISITGYLHFEDQEIYVDSSSILAMAEVRFITGREQYSGFEVIKIS